MRQKKKKKKDLLTDKDRLGKGGKIKKKGSDDGCLKNLKKRLYFHLNKTHTPNVV